MTVQEILTLAPDDGTAKRGQGLAAPKNWAAVGYNNDVLWGECKGSSTYQVAIDLTEPAYKCSCPVRSYPCKHNIGILLLQAQNADAITETTMPDWVSAWIDKRRAKSAPAPSKEPETPQDEDVITKSAEGKAQRRAERLQKMTDGIKELERWLEDLVRQGFGVAEDVDSEFWKRAVARMVDAQLAGPSYAVKEMSHYSGARRMERLMLKAGELFMTVRAFKNMAQLSPALQDELLNTLGVTIQKKELVDNEGLKDAWSVLGKIEGVDLNDLEFRRTWLYGIKNQRFIVIKEFVHPASGASFETNWMTGICQQGEVAFYPSVLPMRAFFKHPPMMSETQAFTLPEGIDIQTLFEQFAEQLTINPWLREYPACLKNIIPIVQEGSLYGVDEHQHQIKLNTFDNLQLFSLAGAKPLTLFGEWDGEQLQVIGAWQPIDKTWTSF